VARVRGPAKLNDIQPPAEAQTQRSNGQMACDAQGTARLRRAAVCALVQLFPFHGQSIFSPNALYVNKGTLTLAK